MADIPPATTAWEQLGGAAGIEGLVRTFVDRMWTDFIIGFQFEGRDKERIVRHEVEHAARIFGADVAYTGRPIGAVHRPLRINRGQFRRRLAVLATVLREAGVPEPLIEQWLAHDRRLEAAITDGTDCVDHGSSEP
jgi:truncated hemoglobin YjbI